MVLPPLDKSLAAAAAGVVDSLATALVANSSSLVHASSAMHRGVRPAAAGGEDGGDATVVASRLATVGPQPGDAGAAAVDALLRAGALGRVSVVRSP